MLSKNCKHFELPYYLILLEQLVIAFLINFERQLRFQLRAIFYADSVTRRHEWLLELFLSASFRVWLMAKMVKWLLSIFSSAHDRHHVLPLVPFTPSFYFSRETRKNARRQVTRRKKEKDGGWGDPSCVVLPESSVNSVGWGVALCVVCHGVLRRVETSHAKRHKREEIRGGFRTHASHNVRNDGLAHALRETP